MVPQADNGDDAVRLQARPEPSVAVDRSSQLIAISASSGPHQTRPLGLHGLLDLDPLSAASTAMTPYGRPKYARLLVETPAAGSQRISSRSAWREPPPSWPYAAVSSRLRLAGAPRPPSMAHRTTTARGVTTCDRRAPRPCRPPRTPATLGQRRRRHAKTWLGTPPTRRTARRPPTRDDGRAASDPAARAGIRGGCQRVLETKQCPADRAGLRRPTGPASPWTAGRPSPVRTATSGASRPDASFCRKMNSPRYGQAARATDVEAQAHALRRAGGRHAVRHR